jgi:hypothetical protein
MAYSFLSNITRSTLVLVLFVGAACGDDSGNQCLPELPSDCTPSINTDFATLQRSLFSPRCGTSGNACHGEAGRKGNLVLQDEEQAYKALLGLDGTHARVSVGDPRCSLLMERLESDDAAKRMPFGEDKLPEGLRCAVRKWIEDGAAR